MTPGAPKRNAARRLLSGLVSILSVVGITALFGAGFTLGLLGHLNLPAGRRAAASVLGNTLADLFQGQVTIGAITKVSPQEVAAEDVVVRDEQHRIVLKITRVTAQADVLDILARLLRADEKLTIVVNHVRVERAEANLIPTEDGQTTLGHALTPRPSPDGPAASGSERYVRVWLPEIEIGQAYARGQINGTPTLEAEISGAHGSLLATPKGAAIDVERFALLARGLGGADAKGVASLHIRAPGAVWSSFDGYIGDMQFGSVVRWEKSALDLKLELPRAEPAAARALLAQWPVLVPVEARVHVKGRPPDFDVDLQAKLGDSAALSATGDLNIEAPARLRLDVEGRQLDLRAVWPSAPATSIDVDTDLGVHAEGGKVLLDLNGALQPTSIAAFQIPAVDFSGKAEGGSFVGEAKIHDRGLPVNLGFSVHADGKIEVDAEAKRVDLARVERLKPYLAANGNADMRVHASLEHGRLDTSMTLDVRGLEYEGVALQSGRLTAGAKGPLDKWSQLALDAHLTGKKLSAGRFAFQDVDATARGPLRAPTLTTSLKDANGPSLDARAKVAFAKTVAVRELSLGVSRSNVEIRGDVAELDVTRDRVQIRDLKLHGASGELSADAELGPQTLSVNAQGQNLDLSAFSRVLGLPRGALEGRASLSLSAVSAGKTQRGSLELSVSKAAIANLNGVSGQLSAKLDGRKLTGASSGTIESLGAFSADWDTELGGAPTERASFEHVTGSGNLALNDVTLDYLGPLLPVSALDVSGRATVKLKLARTEPDAVPDVAISAQTQGLNLRLGGKRPVPLELSGVELAASATLDGQSGNTSLAVSALQGSERLISASGDILLDLKAALAQHESLEHQLLNHPILAKAVVSRLDLETLPSSLRLPELAGVLRVEGTVRGSLSAPVASLGVRAAHLHYGLGDRGEPVDVCGTAQYTKQGGGFSVGAEVFLPNGLVPQQDPCLGKRIANVRLNGQAPYDPERGIPAWNGTALVTLESLPLATIPQLATARIGGAATGTLLLDKSGTEPNASAQLSLTELKMDRLIIGDGTLKLRSDATRARVDFGIQRGPTAIQGGFNAGVSWSSELPSVDDAQPIDVLLHATKLEASILEPLLADFVTELRGSVDGEVSARLLALVPGESARRVEQVAGKVALSGGSFILTGLGFRLRDVDFTANAERDGKTTLVKIDDLVASAGTKTQNLKAQLIFRLAGFDIVSGSGSFNVNSLPLVVDGITRANADATVTKLTLDRNADRVLVDVPFEELVARLPDESSRELIELTDNSNVTLLQPIVEPKAARDEAALPWQFAIHLGPKARIERGVQVALPIGGDPNVVLAAGLGVTGSIMLKRGGTVRILDRMFSIEGGAVVFDTPDPKDPRLDVRASWRSSTGDTLFMYISGTLSKPNVQFDRPLEDARQLLAGGNDNGAGAATIGVSALDTLLASTPLARVQLRGKDSDDSTRGATYTAAYRLDDRVIVEGNYQAAGSEADQSAGRVGAAVDWRLTKTISLRAQAGTIGTGVDLVYQYRY